MKFSTLVFAVTTAVSATTVPAFGVIPFPPLHPKQPRNLPVTLLFKCLPTHWNTAPAHPLLLLMIRMRLYLPLLPSGMAAARLAVMHHPAFPLASSCTEERSYI